MCSLMSNSLMSVQFVITMDSLSFSLFPIISIRFMTVNQEVMTVYQEMTDESSRIWLTSEQMGFPLRSEFANENHGEAGSSKQCND